MSWLSKSKSVRRFLPQKRLTLSGFTLIEVLVAIVILASGIVIIAQALGSTQQILRISHNLVRASQIAEERLAEMEIELRERKRLSLASKQGEERFPESVFKWVRNTGPYTDESIEDQTRINRVDIAVNWNDGPARKNRETLSSVMMNRDKKEQQP